MGGDNRGRPSVFLDQLSRRRTTQGLEDCAAPGGETTRPYLGDAGLSDWILRELFQLFSNITA